MCLKRSKYLLVHWLPSFVQIQYVTSRILCALGPRYPPAGLPQFAASSGGTAHHSNGVEKISIFCFALYKEEGITEIPDGRKVRSKTGTLPPCVQSVWGGHSWWWAGGPALHPAEFSPPETRCTAGRIETVDIYTLMSPLPPPLVYCASPSANN